MKSAIFLMLLGATLVTSLWAALKLSFQIIHEAVKAPTTPGYYTRLAGAVCVFWLVMTGPIGIVITIMMKGSVK